MFDSQDNMFAREVAREIVREQDRNKEGYDTHFETSDSVAIGIIAAGGAAILGIMKPVVYITAASFVGASLFPIGAALTTTGLVGMGVKFVKDRRRGK